MDKRSLGKTGEMLSIVGFGGILVMNETAEHSAAFVAEAVNQWGINYFDVAPSYGNAEEMLGPALEPYRSGVFLACKTGKRDAAGAEEELNRSLKRMRTDHFDTYQLHAVTTLEDVAKIMGPGGALETFVKAREAGKVRFLGFSAHSEAAALALMAQFDFDTILFPFNWSSWLKEGFGPAVMTRAVEKEMGIFALKTLAKRAWAEGEEHDWSKTWYKPVETYEEARLATRFTLSQPVTAGVSPGHIELFRWLCQAAVEFQPITAEELATLRTWAADLKTIFPQG
ncbi:MAG: aldo/keto reductase [Anaerolineae bacterium]|nr:aldo/keto reductase [Anaerolineae bacterium]